MKIGELRDAITGYSSEELRLVIVELYRRIPKRVVEEKNLDSLIEDPGEFLEAQKKPKVKELPDLDYLALEINEFIDDALQGHYFAPNSFIRKSERPKWRFHVKRFHRELVTLMQDPEALPEVSFLLERLFDILCYAENIHLFSSSEPFQSIGVSKAQFYGDLVTAQRAAAADLGWIRQAIDALLCNAGSFGSDLIRQLVDQLTTNPLREEGLRAIVQAYQHRPKPRERKPNPDDQASHLAELALRLCFGLGEHDRGIAFFHKYHRRGDREVRIYCLLQILEEYQLSDLWLREYEVAHQSGVQLRPRLREKYGGLRSQIDAT